LECTSELLEKVMAKCFLDDIEEHECECGVAFYRQESEALPPHSQKMRYHIDLSGKNVI